MITHKRGAFWFIAVCVAVLWALALAGNASAAEQTVGAVMICQSGEELEDMREQAVALALEQLGVPYVWGGTTPAGFDCSGFVQYVYGRLGLELMRTATDQLYEGVVVPLAEIQPGDLVFFNNTTPEPGIVSHVGIYIGDRQLIHAGPNGISTADIDGAYYAPRFVFARRVILWTPPERLGFLAASGMEK